MARSTRRKSVNRKSGKATRGKAPPLRKTAAKGKTAAKRKVVAKRKTASPAKPAAEWLDLGDGLNAYYARPAGRGRFPAVIIYIEAFGVNAHFKKLARRFAREGFCAIVPDLYDGLVVDYNNLDAAIAKLRSLDDDRVMAQTRRTLDALMRRSEVKKGRVGVTGFCMGGRYTFLANAALADHVGAAASFYGGGIAPVKDGAGRRPLLDEIPAMQTPLSFYYGAKDTSILPDEIGRIAEAMAKANKRFTMTVFDDAGHGFFCEDRASYMKPAAQQAWTEMIGTFRAAL